MKRTLAIILSIMLILAISLPAAAISTVAIQSISLDTGKINLQVVQTYKLKITLTPSNANLKTLKYVTANKNVAEVNKDGKIIGIAGGVTTRKQGDADFAFST